MNLLGSMCLAASAMNSPKIGADNEPPVEHELPQYWRDLESRTVNRKPRVDGPRGRGPRRKREEDYWQEAGLYDKPRNE